MEKKLYYFVLLYVIVVVIIVLALYVGSCRSFNALSGQECGIIRSVDFNELSLISSSLNFEDTLDIYILVLDRWGCQGEEFDYLNPFAPLVSTRLSNINQSKYLNNNYESIPEALSFLTQCEFRIVYFEDIYDGQEYIDNKWFTTLSAPKILNNNTVTVLVDSVKTSSGYGAKINLHKNSEGEWKIINYDQWYIT